MKVSRFLFFTIYICLFATPSAFSQDVFRVADSCLSVGDEDRALMEYERVIFFCPQDSVQKIAMYRKALVFKQKAMYLQSAKTLQRIPLYSLNDKERDSVYCQTLLCLYLADDFLFARTTISNMDINTLAAPSSELLLIQILLYNQLQDYNSAYACYNLYKEKNDLLSDDNKKTLDSLYSNLPKLKKEKKAEYLSIFPGLGHIYAGFWGEGLTSFFLNCAVLTFGVWEFFDKHYLTAWIGGAGILSATYLGQKKRAVYLTQKRNYLNTSSFNRKVKDLLLEQTF